MGYIQVVTREGVCPPGRSGAGSQEPAFLFQSPEHRSNPMARLVAGITVVDRGSQTGHARAGSQAG